MAKSSFSVPFIRSPYNYDREAVSDENGLRCEDDSLAQQNFASECDINNIVQTFTRTGMMPPVSLSPRFGDFSGVSDFHSALNRVLSIQEEFLTLPADIRSRFENNPQNLILFLNDPANRDEAVELGLVDKDLSTPARAASTAKRRAGVGKSPGDAKASPEPPAEQEEGV